MQLQKLTSITPEIIQAQAQWSILLTQETLKWIYPQCFHSSKNEDMRKLFQLIMGQSLVCPVVATYVFHEHPHPDQVSQLHMEVDMIQGWKILLRQVHSHVPLTVVLKQVLDPCRITPLGLLRLYNQKEQDQAGLPLGNVNKSQLEFILDS